MVLCGVAERRMESQRSLSPTDLDDETPDATATLRSLLFDRLAPLLILRVLPVEGFREDTAEDAGDLGKVGVLLIERVSQLYEFEEVRKLAAELCGSLPMQYVVEPCLEALWALLAPDVHGLSRAQGIDGPARVKGLLLALCHSISSHGKEANRFAVEIATTVFPVLAAYESDEPREEQGENEDDSVERHKATLAVIDCLALTAQAECQADTGEEGGKASRILSEALACLVSGEGGAGPDVPHPAEACLFPSKDAALGCRVSMGNVLVQFFKMAQPQVAKPVLHMLLQRVAQAAVELNAPALRATCMQILFVGAYTVSRGGDAATTSELMPVCLQGLQDTADEVQMAALKLLGALFGAVAVGGGISEETCQAALGALRGMTTAEDKSEEVRQLAGQLEASIFR